MRFQYSSKQLLILFGIVSIAIATSTLLVRRFQPSLILYDQAADGTEFALYQLGAVDGPFSFETCFYYISPGQDWKHLYYDHEDPDPWVGGKAEINNEKNEVVVYRDYTPEIRLNWKTNVFEKHDGDRFIVVPTLSSDKPPELDTFLKEAYLRAKKDHSDASGIKKHGDP